MKKARSLMIKKERPKMSNAQRAKQFMPFSALVGLDTALREKETEVEKDMDPENDKFEEDS